MPGLPGLPRLRRPLLTVCLVIKGATLLFLHLSVVQDKDLCRQKRRPLLASLILSAPQGTNTHTHAHTCKLLSASL